MFDKPNEELKKLEERLLAVEEPGKDNFEAFYSDILNEFGPGETGKKQAASPKKSSQPKPAAKKGSKKGGKKKKKKNSIRGLVITLCLERAGILAVLQWWMYRFL